MAKKLITDIERLLKSVEVTVDSCWMWMGPTDKDGYARQMKVGSHTDNSRRMARPHRLSYQNFVGDIPEGMTIDHLCRMRCCVNPEHLEPVTGRVNTQRGHRATKLYCVNNHPLFGENLGFASETGFRFCRICQRAAIRKHYRRTDGAAQKKYAEENREKRRLAQAARRASWTEDQKLAQLEYSRNYEATRRSRKTPPKTGGESRYR